ncbi:MAG: aldehyde ferredoxin oxidoreductase family protein [Candidatus Hodarchaeota archaeon]
MGYTGRILRVNLSKNKTSEDKTDKKLAEKYLGGSGLACGILYGMIDRNINPLGIENPLIFMTGPLTGTLAPSCGRYCVCAKSPLTGIWGESNSGGRFGPMLKFSGFDGLIVIGRSSKPVYLLVLDGNAELRSAEGLMGKTTFETQESIVEETGEKRISVACIGPAGENLVKYAAIVNDGRKGSGRKGAAGRTGMGAVMGSKNLKAIAVIGSKKVPLAREEEFREVAKEASTLIGESTSTAMYKQLGTGGFVEMSQEMGSMPNRYFTSGTFENAGRISGSTMAETILVRNSACYGCKIGCGRVVEVKDGKYELSATDGPEYETLCAFGSLILNDNLEGLAYANYLCNAYGIDTISCGSTIAFVTYLFDEGKISKSDTEGVELKWGDIDTLIRLIGMIAQRRGFGNVLAEGVRRVAQKYDALDYAAEVKGLEMPFHDARAFFGMALCYSTSPRGACHLNGDMYLVDLGQEFPELGIVSGDRFDEKDKPSVTMKAQNWRTVYNSMIMCQFCNPPSIMIAKLLTYSIGQKYDIEDLDILGERIFNLKRCLNIKLGVSGKDDYLTRIVLAPLKEGGSKGRTPDLGKMLEEYYELRQWDHSTGKPTKGKLEQLNIANLI